MIGKTLNYISHHAIAILALVCSLLALAGASYAAIAIPSWSFRHIRLFLENRLVILAPGRT